MNNELYPVYHFYIRTLWRMWWLYLPLSAGTAYLVYLLSSKTDMTALTFFGCMAAAVAYSLWSRQRMRCPHCGKRTVALCGEPRNVLSMGWSIAPYEAHCRSCGVTMRTDLALKSNIVFKALPVRVTAEQLDALRHDTF